MSKYLFPFGVMALLAMFSCNQNKTTETDPIDSIQKAEADEVWEPITPDTAAMRQKFHVVEIVTNMGKLELALFDATPKHRDNFLKLIGSGFYNGQLFHRIIKDFMVQAGDPASKGAPLEKSLGEGGPGYTIPAEMIDTLHHYRGALCAARTSNEINPEKASSGSQFYIVWGKKSGTNELKKSIEERALISFMSDEDNISYALRMRSYQNKHDDAAMQVLRDELGAKVRPITDSLYNSIPKITRRTYATWGGFPMLDKEYTIFGFLVSGYDVLERIQGVQTLGQSRGDRPANDVTIISTRVVK